MITAPFTYHRAVSVEHALDLLAAHGDDAKLLAGGHSLLPLMKLRLTRPAHLVDIGRLEDLRYIRYDDDAVAIGGLTRHADLVAAPLLAREAPLLPAAAAHVGDVQVRARGTIGGNLAHGDPAADLAAVVLALDGTLVVQGPGRRREIAADRFFGGFRQTALRPGEILVEIRVPSAATAGWGYQRFGRRMQDPALVGVAVCLGDVPRVALMNMADRPVRATAVEQALAAGQSPAEAAEHAAERNADLGPVPTDPQADATYRAHLARRLTERALQHALTIT